MIGSVIRKSFAINNCIINRELVFYRPAIPIFLQNRSLKKSIKDRIDFSKVPEVKEEDLEEQFIHGGGSGGQKVNKAHNCVLLKHLPTGTVVKVHEFREGHKNRVLARERLKEKLDDLINGEESVVNQIKRIEELKRKTADSKRAKLRELKKQFKESLSTTATESNLDTQDTSDPEVVNSKITENS